MNDKHIKLIIESQLFDEDFYNRKYEDIARRGNDPLRHFVRHGYKEGRLPNEFFDTLFYKKKYLANKEGINPLIHYITSENTDEKMTSPQFDGEYYLSRHSDVKCSGANPLLHYIQFGLKEGREAIPPKPLQHLHIPRTFFDVRTINTTIIIPVYNAINEVIECIDSVLLNTELDSSTEVLVLNDGSPDKIVKKELSRYKNISGLTVKNALINIGYTKNVNKGLKYAKNRDVVLLNSDTIVTPNWLRNLKNAAYSAPTIGTVTAVSNNAGAFSVPKSGTNILPEGLTVKQVGRAVSTKVPANYVNVPTGNGFCLYIKRALIQSIGIFDKQSFPKGYGEENDFCMRALSKGWHNIVDPSTYIYHVRSASFKDSKAALIKSGVAEVKRKFPEYEGAIKNIAQNPYFKEARNTTSQLFANLKNTADIVKPKIMFVISTRTGGTPQTNMDLMLGIKDVYDTYVLASNTRTIEVMQVVNNEYKTIEKVELKEIVKFATHKSLEYDNVIKDILVRYSIELLHIRHIAWHSLNLPNLAKSLSIPVVNSFHDFYAVCPTVNLIDKFGALDLTGVKSNGANPLWRDETVYDMNDSAISRWQTRMHDAFSSCDAYVTTCESAKEILMNNNIVHTSKETDFHVISHGRNFETFVSNANNVISKARLKVLLPGNISASKGKTLILDIVKLDVKKEIEFHVLGACDEELDKIVINHGRYQREEFQTKVNDIAPDVAAVFSIWPETYCHTLTESWASGIPVLGVAFGAVQERINKHGGGWLVEPNATAMYKKLLSILNTPEKIAEQRQKVMIWQNGYGKQNTIAAMASQYLFLYQSVLINKFSAAESCTKKLGFIMKGQFPNVPATAYVRLVDWKPYFEERYKLPVEFTTWQSLLTTDILKYSKVVIQRDAIPSDDVWRVLVTLKKFGIPYIYEIDDNLLDVPAEIDKEGTYQAYAPHFKTLISGAEEVHVTNDALKTICGPLSDNVFIRPNKISATRWQVTESNQKPLDLDLTTCDLKVLYFGSKTHQKDLNFVIEAIKEARTSGINIHLYVVGAGDDISKGEGFVHRLTPPSGRYDIFVEWIKPIASLFDVSIAPLVDEKFSPTKSYLKCLESISLGLPVVCSDVDPYKKLKDSDLSESIVFLKNTTDLWCKWFTEYQKDMIAVKIEKPFII
jgi:GT2 family glycosyltransferase/glycosyltransferase involved in cell wall biosynthesis